jgi:DNA-binding CsgD family transcriptional regulator
VTTLEIVGRDEELAVVAGFLADTDSLSRVLVIEGEPGIGKTTVWRYTVEEGRALGYRVLTARPGRSEAQLAFAGLSDLLEDPLEELLPMLPPPQARALRVALLLDDPDPRPADSRAVAAAVLGSLRGLAREGPLLVAIDDVQWLDASSAAALRFALHRLTDEPVGIGVTSRTDEAPAHRISVTAGLEEERTARLKLQPLTLGALHRILVSRLDLALPRPALRHLKEVSGGNPFFAIELGRALQERGRRPGLHDPLPVPDTLAELLGDRLAALPVETREALLFAALASEPTVPLVARALDANGWNQLRPAADRGVIAFEGERICFSHPLLASSVEAEADLERRRHSHARLATVVSDPIARARHLALSSSVPAREVADALADASVLAARRGASAEAAELAEQAMWLTPANEVEVVLSRRVEAARRYGVAGDRRRAETLLEDGLAQCRAGASRARLLSELAEIQPSLGRCAELLRTALDDAADDDALRAIIHRQLAVLRETESVELALAHAQEAVAIAERIGDPLTLAGALGNLSLLRFDAGYGIDERIVRRVIDLERRIDPLQVVRSARFDVAEQLVWGGRHLEARPLLEALRGELRSRQNVLEADALWYLAFVELKAGRWPLAADYSERCELVVEQSGYDADLPVLWCRASVVAHRGEVDATRRYAARIAATAERTGASTYVALGRGVLGFLALSLGDVAEARDELVDWQRSWFAKGVREPGKWVYGPDLVEALVAVGDMDSAARALEPWQGTARILDRAHMLAQAARGRALIAAADGDFSEASAQIELALAEHSRSRVPFQEARTYLALGSIERRRRHRRAARAALEQALGEFERLGAPLWAERARAELARVGGRGPSRGNLTPTERKVAELVAEGLATKEVAARLFVSPRTVDGHLTHIYAKLGVRSRTDLANRLARRPG